jgi:hypothetical protein
VTNTNRTTSPAVAQATGRALKAERPRQVDTVAVARHRVLWESSIDVGHEWCELDDDRVSPGLRGFVVVVGDDVPWRVEYRIELDPNGLTSRLRIEAEGVSTPVTIDVSSDRRGRWTRTGTDDVVVDDAAALDVDLGFSPSTNTLPIRRLGLEIGETREIGVLWVLFPSFEIVAGRQRYERLGERSWRYRSGTFVGDLVVDEAGLVETYAEWRAIARTIAD